MTVTRLFNIARKHVETSGQDHVLLAVDQRNEAVLVEEANVAGVKATAAKATAAKGFLGRLRPLPVPHECLIETANDRSIAFVTRRTADSDNPSLRNVPLLADAAARDDLGQNGKEK